MNDFAGLSAIPGSGQNAQQGYRTLAVLTQILAPMVIQPAAGVIARMGAAATMLPNGMGIGIVQIGRVIAQDLTVSTSHRALAAEAGVLGADGTLTRGAQAITWTVENGVIRTTASINFPSQTGAATEAAVEKLLQAILKTNGGP